MYVHADCKSISFENVEQLPFGYFKVQMVNNENSDSPLGVSVFSRAVDEIQKADKRYSQIDWEYDSKEAAVHVAQSLFMGQKWGKIIYLL